MSNKYDYFERAGEARLYRMPAGQSSPVEFVCGSEWEPSSHDTRDSFLGDPQLIGQISVDRAREISNGAPIDENPVRPRYYWCGHWRA